MQLNWHVVYITGRCPRGLGLETRSRRGLPHTAFPASFVRHGWQWHSIVCHVWSDPWSALPHYLNHPVLTVLSVLVFALLGFLSPSNRGSLATVMMICWTFFGGYATFFAPWDVNTHQSLSRIGGYFSSRVYASLGGTDRRKNAFLTATALPTWVHSL